jgi:hypothetical protein
MHNKLCKCSESNVNYDLLFYVENDFCLVTCSLLRKNLNFIKKKILFTIVILIYLGFAGLNAQVGGGSGSPVPGPMDECDIPSYLASPTWLTGSLKVFLPCPDIKVGIGTRYPDYNLHNTGNTLLNGNVSAMTNLGIGALARTNTNLYIKSKPSYFSMLHLEQTGVAPYFKMIYMQVAEPTAEVIKVDNTVLNFSPFLLTASGNMTISNANGKTLELEAGGMLRARHIKIDTDVWPDYVFSKEYRLKSLTDVEIFIKEHNHLPNVPSEEEMIANGIDLQEINVLLLEKIEELTLYLIELKKEIDEVKNNQKH